MPFKTFVDPLYILTYSSVKTQVKSKEHLLEELKSVQDDGGEGLMLREPKSLYEGRRSKTLLKVVCFPCNPYFPYTQ